MHQLRILLSILALIVACGDDPPPASDDNNGDDPCATAGAPKCGAGFVEVSAACAGCVEQELCGSTVYCQPDPTCDTPCPTGEYEAFEACVDGDAQCTTRMACGAEVACRDQVSCLAETTCQDGGLLLEACPPGSQGCLPYQACGVTKYCLTLSQCARESCDPGEAPTTVACADTGSSLPCREITACGDARLSCVCQAEALLCEDDEMFDTNPCTPGQICREVQGCGMTFYCKGDSI